MTNSQQKLTLTLVLVTLLASNVVALAQAKKTPVTKSPTPAELQLDAPGNDSLAAPPAQIDMPAIPDMERTAQGSPAADQNVIVTASEATRLRELEEKVARLEQLIEGQTETLQDIAKKIGTPNEELRAIREELVKLNSKQTVARPELGGDQPSLANIGKLVISNYTGIAYTMSVNGQQFVISPGRGEINVQFGPVTTELMGFEGPKAWAQTDWREVNGQQQLAIQIR
jgi:uncharacterized coiled-coil protein SlyX